MSDLDAIKEIKKIIGKNLKLRRRDKKELKYRSPDHYLMDKYHSYMLNGEQQQVIGLNLDGFKLTQIDFLKSFPNLKQLYLINNQISDISVLKYLPNLKVIFLSANKISDINVLKDLPNLTEIDLSHNQISDISVLKDLPNLTKIDLNHNQISDISVLYLTHIYLINLRYNKVKFLPELLFNLRLKFQDEDMGYGEKGIYLEGNPLEEPPIEIIKKGNEAIHAYFKQLKQGQDSIYEAKLILVGEGGAGKTSLANKIINPDWQLIPEIESQSTQGIDILRYEFPYKDKKFKVNIWDFGGQEIYHQTHQFFLSKRSLYLIVADSRTDSPNLDYWFKLVELLSNNSPLLIIKNEKQDRKCISIQESQLKAEFENIKDGFATNLSDNRGLNTIIENLQHYLCQLPHIGSPLPKTWVKVREQLEQDSRYYIDLKDYFSICQANGFENEADKRQLSGYLHDLGVCLHFQEHDLLDKTLILKPTWATDAVYKVLDNSEVIKHSGRFNKDDLKQIWQAAQYTEMRGELLALMQKFKLCYEIPNQKNHYISPQLLKDKAPPYDWQTNDNLLLRYKYDFMPKGILSQFIVEMHEHIANDYKSVWKSGVILEKDKTQAEIIEYYGKREIHIRVYGNNKKELLNIVSYELDKINSSYERLKDKCKKLIPCLCETCTSLENPHFHDYAELKERIANKKYTIECRKPPYKDVDILKLVEDIGIPKLSNKDYELEQERKHKDLLADLLKESIQRPITINNQLENNLMKEDNSRNFTGDATNSNVNLGDDSVQTNTITQSNESGNQTQNKPAESKEDSLFKKLGFYALIFAFVYSSLAAVLAYDLQKDGKVGNKTYKEIVSLPSTVIADLFKDEKKEGK